MVHKLGDVFLVDLIDVGIFGMHVLNMYMPCIDCITYIHIHIIYMCVCVLDV